MIAVGQPFCEKPAAKSQSSWHAGFLALLPDIHRHVRFAFRRLQSDRREEAIQEALANALVAYIRLHELGKTAVAYARSLADYAVRQFCGGRQVACPLNSYEVLSRYAQRKRGFTVNRLQRPDESEGAWKEILVDDPTARRPNWLRAGSTSTIGYGACRDTSSESHRRSPAAKRHPKPRRSSRLRRAGSRSCGESLPRAGISSMARRSKLPLWPAEHSSADSLAAEVPISVLARANRVCGGRAAQSLLNSREGH